MLTPAIRTIEERLIPRRLFFLAAGVTGSNLFAMLRPAVRAEELRACPRRNF